MLIALRKQQKVDFMQHVSSKKLISHQKTVKMLMITYDHKDVEFTSKTLHVGNISKTKHCTAIDPHGKIRICVANF